MDGLFKYKQSWMYVPQSKYTLLKENYDSPIAGHRKKKGKKNYHQIMSNRQHWPCTKRNVTSYQKQVVAYHAKAMAWYVHGFDHKFAKVTRVSCHLVDNESIYEVGTHDADCGNRNCVRDRITFSQWWKHHGLLRMIVLDGDPKLTGAFWRHLLKNVRIRLMLTTTFHFQMDGEVEHVNEASN